MNTQTEFEIAADALRAVCKSHTKAALYIGISPEHWRRVRNHRVAVTKRLIDLVILKAEQAAKEKANA